MAMLLNLTAVVTGASSGIGRAIAISLAREGASLCLLGRNEQRLRMTTKLASHGSSKIRTYCADFSSDQDLSRITLQLKQELKRLHILVHAAGNIILGDMSASAVEDFDRQYAVNLRAPYALTHSLLRQLTMCQGQVVFINSSMGLHTKAQISQYAATKHGLKAMADTLRHEVNAEGVRVLNVFAGKTASAMQEKLYHNAKRPYDPKSLLQPEDIASMVISALTLPRTAEVTDIHIRPLIKSV
jgi:short-subunit dehydrogenase